MAQKPPNFYVGSSQRQPLRKAPLIKDRLEAALVPKLTRQP